MHSFLECFKLSPQEQILNALFTQPNEWTIMPPALLELGTNITSQYVGTNIECSDDDYVHFVSTTLPPALSHVEGGFIIYLTQVNFNYTFTYKTKGCTHWYKAIQSTGQAFPLVDIFGNNVNENQTNKQFTVGGYNLFVVCKSDCDIDLTVTATFAPSGGSNVYDFDGPFFISLDGKAVQAATKYNSEGNIALVPSPQYLGLASLLRGINMLCPLHVNFPLIPPPGRRTIIGETNAGSTIAFDIGFGFHLGQYNSLSYTPLLPVGMNSQVSLYTDQILYLMSTSAGSYLGLYRVTMNLRIAVNTTVVTNPIERLTLIDNLGSMQPYSYYAGSYNQAIFRCGSDSPVIIVPSKIVNPGTKTFIADYTDTFTMSTLSIHPWIVFDLFTLTNDNLSEDLAQGLYTISRVNPSVPELVIEFLGAQGCPP